MIVVLIPKQPDDNRENCIEINVSLVSFLHILQGGTQGWMSVSMLLKDVLSRIKTMQPNLHDVFPKSDNAGCYHSLQMMAYIWKRNSLFPLWVREYNFIDLQSGKDPCDSRTGSCRMKVLTFANEGNNIENQADLNRAQESYTGVRNTFVTLVRHFS